MTIPNDLNSKLNDALIESTDTPGEVVLKVANADGSNISGGGGSGGATETTLADLNGKIAPASEFVSSLVLNGTSDDQLSCGLGANVLIAFDISTSTFQPVSATSDAGVTYLYTRVFNTADDPLVAVGNIAHDVADAGNPIKIGAKAVDPTSLPTAVAANDRSNVYTSLQGELLFYKSRLDGGEDLTNNVQGVLPKPIAGSTYTGTVTQNNSFATSNVKASAGNVLKFSVINTTSSTRYFQIHNTATTPGGGATAAHKWLVPASSQVIIGPTDIGDAGLYLSTGIAIANSTAASTYTAGSAGDLLLEITTI